MLESVLSPNQSVSNQVLGAMFSPGHGNLNSKQQEPVSECDNKPEDVVNKENAPLKAFEKDTKLELKSAEPADEPISSSTPPKRHVDAVCAESPESNSKKARFNDNVGSGATDEVELDPTATASPPKTSTSSRSVDALLADLARTKSALQQSKETLKLLKEHQQKLSENGASMSSRVQAFDEELTKLKQSHEENGKDLEKVLLIRDSAVASFKAAEETLQKITSKKYKDEVNVSVDEPANEENDGTVVIADASAGSVDQGMEETPNVEEEIPGCHNVAEGKEEEICGSEGEEDEEEKNEAEEECEKEAEATAQNPGATEEPDEEASTPNVTDTFETPFDEKKSEPDKLELEFINDKNDVQAGREDEDDAEPSVGVIATIDDTLALELQNADGNDSDDDSLISM